MPLPWIALAGPPFRVCPMFGASDLGQTLTAGRGPGRNRQGQVRENATQPVGSSAHTADGAREHKGKYRTIGYTISGCNISAGGDFEISDHVVSIPGGGPRLRCPFPAIAFQARFPVLGQLAWGGS